MAAYVDSLLQATVAPERQAVLMAQLDALPPGDRRCIALRVEYGLDTAGIAAVLGWKTCEVQASLNRFIRIVKPALAGGRKGD